MSENGLVIIGAIALGLFVLYSTLKNSPVAQAVSAIQNLGVPQ